MNKDEAQQKGLTSQNLPFACPEYQARVSLMSANEFLECSLLAVMSSHKVMRELTMQMSTFLQQVGTHVVMALNNLENFFVCFF